MAVTNASGSQVCTVTTEHTLVTTSTVGTFVAQFNLTTAVAGDLFRLRVKTKVLTGDTAEAIFDGVFANDLGSVPIIHTPPLASMFSLIVTLEQTTGTSRTIPWALIQIDA